MSSVISAKTTVSTARITAPWRRGRVGVNEADSTDTKVSKSLSKSALAAEPEIKDDVSTSTGCSDGEDCSTRSRTDSDSTSDTSPKYTPPWRRGRNVVKNTGSDILKSTADDDASLTTGCSDDEDARSMSQSGVEDNHVISRNALLVHRERMLSRPKTEDPPLGLHCRSLVKAAPPRLTAKAPSSVPAGFVAPPGLGSAPPGLGSAPPGLGMLKGAALAVPAYTPPGFRKELMAILKDLAIDRNVARAVRCIRAQRVPQERQAAEYADAITFVLEESRGAARRSFVALLAGLAYGVFERKQCIAGLDIFFLDVFQDLQEEVPKLNKMVLTELLPTLGSVFAADELSAYESLAKL